MSEPEEAGGKKKKGLAQHWKILLWMLAGVIVGGVFQYTLEAPAYSGLTVVARPGPPEHVDVTAATKLADRFSKGDKLWAVVLHRGNEGEERRKLTSPEDLKAAIGDSAVGDIVWFEVGDAPGAELVPLTLDMRSDSPRARWLAPFKFLASIFMALLKMLIVPLILTSIISGVAGVGKLSDLRRMGLKTFAYYIVTSICAILIGQTLVNIIEPGTGARLGLPTREFVSGEGQSLWDVLLRMVPPNLFDALRDNGQMLQIIFFGLLFGLCITLATEPHKGRLTGFFESAFEVMMRVAEVVLKLIPYGVFCLMIKVVGESGLAVFVPLAKYMLMVAGGLLIHGCVVLPLILKWRTGISPLVWMRTMGPALMTAFSASSSSMTLPVTLRCVEKRAGISNRTSSFVLPLGATINMDGTALYECAGVIFLAQYYASTSDYVLTFTDQFLVVFLALFASIGAAGIPSAGLIMMLTILTTLGLPTEGAVILLAVDRPLDMLRTMVNVWSDSVGTAVIASSEGEKITGELLEPADEPTATEEP